MRAERVLGPAAAVWLLGIWALYVHLMDRQGSTPVAWFAWGLLAIAVVAAISPLLGSARPFVLTPFAVLLGVFALLGMLSIGVLLVPPLALLVADVGMRR